MGVSVSISQAELQRQHKSLLKKEARVRRQNLNQIKPFDSIQNYPILGQIPIKVNFKPNYHRDVAHDSGLQNSVTCQLNHQVHIQSNQRPLQLEIKNKSQQTRNNTIESKDFSIKIDNKIIPYVDNDDKQQQLSSQLDSPFLENRISLPTKTSPLTNAESFNKINSIHCSQQNIRDNQALSREEVEPIKPLNNLNIKQSVSQVNLKKQFNPEHVELTIAQVNQSHWDIPKETSILENVHKFKTKTSVLSMNKLGQNNKNQSIGRQMQKINKIAENQRDLRQIIFQQRSRNVKQNKINVFLTKDEDNSDHYNSSLTCLPN